MKRRLRPGWLRGQGIAVGMAEGYVQANTRLPGLMCASGHGRARAAQRTEAERYKCACGHAGRRADRRARRLTGTHAWRARQQATAATPHLQQQRQPTWLVRALTCLCSRLSSAIFSCSLACPSRSLQATQIGRRDASRGRSGRGWQARRAEFTAQAHPCFIQALAQPLLGASKLGVDRHCCLL